MTERREGEPLQRVLREITRVIETGQRIDTREYLARYPKLAGGLKDFFRTRGLEGGEGTADSGLEVGTVLGDYRIVRPIGRGGMGSVYEAEQISLGRAVALKVLPPGALRNQRSVDRFRREASAVARLSHPGIVAVHGFNQSGDSGYLAMELVRGLDLAQIIDRLRSARMHGRRFVLVSGPNRDDDIAAWARGRRLIGTVPGDPRAHEGIVIDLRNYATMAAAMAAEAADALHHAHIRGVVHRDVKPSNLILGENGRIKLSDFGLAKSVRDLSITQSGDFLGSPAYVSPEQASSRRGKVDERSDIYSLGVTLYEFVTLHQPFPGKDVADVLRKILTRDPPPPARVQPRIPRDLDTIIRRAIDKEPDRRYPTAQALADDLRHFLNYEPISSRPMGSVLAVFRWVRRHRVRLALGFMAAVILVLSVVLARRTLSGGQSDDAMVRRVAQQLATTETDELSAGGILQLAEELAAELPEAERRRRLAALADQARRLLSEGRYEEVGHLLTLVDVKGSLRLRETAEHAPAVRDLKVALVRSVRERLTGTVPGPGPDQRRAWLGVLERLLMDPNPLVCKNAAAALGLVADPSSLGALVDALARREDVSGRVAILKALAVCRHAGSVPYIAEQLRSRSPPLRFAALEALEALAPPELTDLVAPLNRDPEAWIRHRQRRLLNRRVQR